MKTRTVALPDADALEQWCRDMERGGAVHVASVMLAGRVVEAKYTHQGEIWEVKMEDESYG